MADQPKEIVVAVSLRDQITAGMAKINGTLDRTRDVGVRTRAALGPVAGVTTTLLGALAGIATVNRALTEARTSIDATQRLTSALGDQGDELARIGALADRYQATTTIGSAAVRSAAADLLNRNVAVNQVAEALEGAVALSAGLNISLDQAATMIAATYGGTVPREIAKALPGLAALSTAELKSGEAARRLSREYVGFAEAARNTSVGKVAAEQNRLGDALEKIGVVLFDLQGAGLEVVNDELERAVSLLNSPAVQRILRTTIEYAPAAAKAAAAFIALAAAQKAWALASAVSKTAAAAAIPLAFVTGSALAAEELSLVIDRLRGVDSELNTLEKRRQVVVDVVLKLSTGDLSFKELGNQLANDVIGGLADKAGLESVKAVTNALDADRLKRQVGNVGSKNDPSAAERVAKQVEQFKQNAATLLKLQDEYNALAEGKDEATAKRRDEIALERLELRHKQQLVSTTAYLTERDKLERDALDRELGYAQDKVIAAERVLKEARDNPNADEAVTKAVVDAQRELNRLLPDILAYKQQIELLDAKQAARRFDAGRSAAAEAVSRATEAQERYNDTVERTANLERVNAISGVEARRRVTAATINLNITLDEAKARLQELKDAGIIDDATVAEFRAKLDEMGPLLFGFVKEAVAVLVELRGRLQAPFEEFFNTIIDGSADAGDAVRQLGVNILKSIQQVMVNRIVTQFLDGLFGAAIGGVAGGAGGGAVAGLAKFNTGGVVPGHAGGPDRDSVPAMLTPGEFVVRRRAAMVSPKILELLNRGDISDSILRRILPVVNPPIDHGLIHRVAYNAGGTVTSAPPVQSAPSMPFVVADERTAETMLRAGDTAVDRMLHRKSAMIRKIAAT